MVLWLVVGMVFFRNDPISEVARRLNICAEGLANNVLLVDSALSQARQRLGSESPTLPREALTPVSEDDK